MDQSPLTPHLLAAAEMMEAGTYFEQTTAQTIREVVSNHDLWAEACRVPHWNEGTPCPDYERILTTAMAWLISEGGGGDA